MTREEWLDYFETVNGRKPSVQEMADALKAGEFVNEVPAKTEDSGNNNSTFYGCFSRRTSSYGKFGS